MLTQYATWQDIVYAVYAPEVSASGTPHIQGYVRFKNACGLTAVRRYLPTAHWEPARGTDQENRTYICGPYDKGDKHKDENPEAVESGTIQVGRGHRSDIDTVRDLVKDGASFREVLDTSKSFQGVQWAMKALPYYEPPRSWKTEVIWLWGPTGTGKSHVAWEEAGVDAYAPVSFKWWDGYDGHENVILDDIRSDWATYNQFLQLFDKYPFRVECKGGSRQFVAKKIWVTSPYDPPAFFQMEPEALNQLIRRITVVRHLAQRYTEV